MSEPAIAEPAEPEPAIAEPSDDPIAALPAEPEPSVVVSAVFFLQAGATASAAARNIIAMRIGYPPSCMLRGFARRITLAGLLSSSAIAWADPPVRLPQGTRAEADHYVSGRGLRDTTDAIAKELERRGIAVDQIGPAAVRGVELTRFVSRSTTTSWLAIHVMRAAGKTLIFFVARPSS